MLFNAETLLDFATRSLLAETLAESLAETRPSEPEIVVFVVSQAESTAAPVTEGDRKHRRCHH